MKTSLFLIFLIVFNTTIIISEPITKLISGINIWWFVGFECILIIGYYINKKIKDFKSHCEMDFNNINLIIKK